VPSSPEIERTIRTFDAVEDIVNAMKAYAGVTIKRTEEMVRAVRAYEEQVFRGLALLAERDPGPFSPGPPGGRKILVAFGSSQGLCGALNERVADALPEMTGAGDALLVVGRRLVAAAESRRLAVPASADSVVSVSGIRPALETTVSWILERYRAGGYYGVSLLFTSVAGPQPRVVRERILPPDLSVYPAAAPAGAPPVSHLPDGELLQGLLRELIGIGIYRAYAESLRSENWYRMRVLEGATENLNRHIAELGSLRNYLRQEEITEEMLEILSSGGFYGR
jgi:ATP synthase F1 gamma subunit